MAGFAWTPSSSEKVNTEVTGTFTLKDNDVSAIYIDWADGASTKKDEANYQWIEITDAPSTVTATHTYNATGVYSPVLQFINSRGFASKYMSPDPAHGSNVQPFQRNVNIGNISISDDSPTAIMRVENTTSNSGIDNSIMESEGPADVYLGIAPTLSQIELNTIGQVKVRIKAIVEISKYNATAGANTNMASQTAQVDLDLDVDLRTATTKQNSLYSILLGTTSPLGNGVVIYGKVAKILEFKYISCKAYGQGVSATAIPQNNYSINNSLNKLKIFLVAKSRYTDRFYPVTYVSAGMPVKSVDDRDRYVVMDFSQSRAAASNVTLSNYRYDNGKMWDSYNPVNNWSLSTNILSTPLQSGNTKREHYSYLTPAKGFNTTGGTTGKFLFTDSTTDCLWYLGNGVQDELIALDDFGRIPDQYHIVRNSVLAASNSGSIITSNQPVVYDCVPSLAFTGGPDEAVSINFTDYTTPMQNNASGSSWIAKNINATISKDMFNNPVYDNNSGQQQYMILGFTTPTNKVGFNIANWAQKIITDVGNAANALSISSVDYLAIDGSGTKTQNAYWKPLKFKDTTRYETEHKDDGDEDYKYYSASFCKSGYISYDMPLDWQTTNITNVCGGVYNATAGTLAECIADAGKEPDGTTDRDVIITGTSTKNLNVTNSGDSFTIVNAATGPLADKMALLGDADDVGAYKYIGIIKSGSRTTLSGAAFWVASGTSTNGWNGLGTTSSAVTFQVGRSNNSSSGAGTANAQYVVTPNNGDTVEMIIRRINAFDVFPGSSRVFQDVNTNTTPANAKIMTVGSDKFRANSVYFNSTYNLMQAAATGSTLATTPKYLLKIGLKGETGDGSAANPAPQFENMLDANQGDSAMIKVVDDSGYSLNSLAVTSDISLSRAGHYFKAVTRKGKVFVQKTGVQLSTFGMSSVALGDENSSSAFDDHGASTLYGHLHTIRRIQADNVPIYWDEIQKDGTYVRLFGNVTDLTETRGTGGPRAIVNYSFNITIREIALLDGSGDLMTDLFPIGGIQNERIYS